MIYSDSTGEELLSALVWYFSQKTDGYSNDMRAVLEKCRCDLHVNCDADLGFVPDFFFHIELYVPPDDIDFASSVPFHAEFKTALRFLVDGLQGGTLVPTLDIKARGPEEPRTVGLNNAAFYRETTILHDDLRFRSKGEMAIYEELKRRDVLFLPNPAAVFGTSALEYGAKVERREPDFLICFRGKWGILEINSDDFHSGIVKTSKDHERARRFNHYGLFFVQAYDLHKCKTDPVGVVDEFLKLLANHK
jgi:hypothetical protein